MIKLEDFKGFDIYEPTPQEKTKIEFLQQKLGVEITPFSTTGVDVSADGSLFERKFYRIKIVLHQCLDRRVVFSLESVKIEKCWLRYDFKENKDFKGKEIKMFNAAGNLEKILDFIEEKILENYRSVEETRTEKIESAIKDLQKELESRKNKQKRNEETLK